MSPTESEKVELKQSLNEWRGVVESVAAFATATGGTVHVGIAPAGARAGVELGRGTVEQLANQIKANTEPPQFPSIEVEGPESSAVLVVRVEEAPLKPVCAFGLPFKRVGRTNQRLTMDEAYRLRQVTIGRSWDALPFPGLTASDLDRTLVEAFLRRAHLEPSTTTEAALANLQLFAGAALTNAAALLFATEPRWHVLGAQVKCARFAGTNSVTFIDEQTLEGPVFGQIEHAVAFVTRNTRKGIRITGRPEREEIPEYPLDAVREAITNAVCHRDYTASSTVQVRIYDDRLAVWNPGVLPPDLTVDDLYRQHESRPRNRLIAHAFYRARLIEHWGTGTLRMVQECEAAGIPRPEFRVERGTFQVCFTRAAPRAGDSLGSRGERALDYAREHGAISRDEYRSLFRLGERRATYDLTELVAAGVFRRVGRGPSARYEVED